jgi:hypothetical protein
VEPKILYNPKDTVVEFMCGGKTYIFQPGEKRNLEGYVADHALRFVNTGLKEYVPNFNEPEEIKSSSVAYDKMPWKKVVSIASARGVFKPGVSKKEVIAALEKLDESER